MRGAVLCVFVLAVMVTMGEGRYWRRPMGLPFIYPHYPVYPTFVQPTIVRPRYVEPTYVQPTYVRDNYQPPQQEFAPNYQRGRNPGAIPSSTSSSTAYGPGATASSSASNAY